MRSLMIGFVRSPFAKAKKGELIAVAHEAKRQVVLSSESDRILKPAEPSLTWKAQKQLTQITSRKRWVTVASSNVLEVILHLIQEQKLR